MAHLHDSYRRLQCLMSTRLGSPTCYGDKRSKCSTKKWSRGLLLTLVRRSEPCGPQPGPSWARSAPGWSSGGQTSASLLEYHQFLIGASNGNDKPAARTELVNERLGM